MIATMYLPVIGLIKANVHNIIFERGEYQFVGKNNKGDVVRIIADRIVFPDDFIFNYGWMHITAYISHGKKYQYEKYVSLG